MKIIIQRSDYKTRRQMDVIGNRLIKAGYGFAQEMVGAPKENISVSVRPSDAHKVLEVINSPAKRK